MPDEVTSQVGAYHAHIYYDVARSRAAAEWVRTRLGERFPAAVLGRWHDVPVGPHTQAMYQVAFAAELLPTLLPWLMLNRQGLDVLVHPETGRERADHTDHAAWLGQALALDVSRLAEG
jgi:DOPA 4,5-dioxygenase